MSGPTMNLTEEEMRTQACILREHLPEKFHHFFDALVNRAASRRAAVLEEAAEVAANLGARGTILGTAGAVASERILALADLPPN